MMNIIRNERFKHRLIGLAVIVSILAIFAPAILKQSNQHLEFRPVSAKLPTKPALPEVSIPDEATSFKRMKLAHIELPELEPKPEITEEAPRLATEEKRELAISKVEPIGLENKELNQASLEVQASLESKSPELSDTNSASELAFSPKQEGLKEKPVLERKAPALADKAPVKKSVVKKSVVKKTAPPMQNIKRKVSARNMDAYFLQLGTFTRKRNANLLVTKLKTKGYSAFYKSLATGNGVVYKVFVGRPRPMLEAQRLKQQIAHSLKINGFVVSTREIS